jgi:hypothetical protein
MEYQLTFIYLVVNPPTVIHIYEESHDAIISLHATVTRYLMCLQESLNAFLFGPLVELESFALASTMLG